MTEQVPHSTPILAWHFVFTTLRDGSAVPPDNVPLDHSGPIVPCQSGLHASVRLIDALKYAPGGTLCRVACSGTVVQEADKVAASRRVILWRLTDTDEILRSFARQCALDVAHLWDMPVIVLEYLETGDETKRAAANAAAMAAAWDAARDAQNTRLEAVVYSAAGEKE